MSGPMKPAPAKVAPAKMAPAKVIRIAPNSPSSEFGLPAGLISRRPLTQACRPRRLSRVPQTAGIIDRPQNPGKVGWASAAGPSKVAKRVSACEWTTGWDGVWLEFKQTDNRYGAMQLTKEVPREEASMAATTETRATVDDLYRTEGKAELIGGRIVHLMATGFKPNKVAGRIYRSLAEHADVKGGHAFTDNMGFTVHELPSGRESFSPDAA